MEMDRPFIWYLAKAFNWVVVVFPVYLIAGAFLPWYWSVIIGIAYYYISGFLFQKISPLVNIGLIIVGAIFCVIYYHWLLLIPYVALFFFYIFANNKAAKYDD